MEKYNRRERQCKGIQMDENWKKRQRLSKIITGLLVIGVGVIIMMKQMGMVLPGWILSWKTLLIAIGFTHLIRHNFKGMAGYVLILIGTVFLFNDLLPLGINPKFVWPVAIIGFGILIVSKTVFGEKKNISFIGDEKSFYEVDSDDFIKAESFFGGVTKNVVSKNFKGASVSCVFGGTELNLMQTDFEKKAVIDLNCVFGGVTMIIPSDWKVVSDLTSVFGGIEDKRPVDSLNLENDAKVLVLRGKCVFGGVEIDSYK
jgi:predicted membrane protein